MILIERNKNDNHAYWYSQKGTGSHLERDSPWLSLLLGSKASCKILVLWGRQCIIEGCVSEDRRDKAVLRVGALLWGHTRRLCSGSVCIIA